MSTFLVIRTLDVNYLPQPAKTVKVSFDQGDSVDVPLAASGEESTYEIQVPDGTKSLLLKMTQKGFFDIAQSLIFNAGPPPTLSFDGQQALNIRNLDGHTRGTDFNVEVYAVLGHLKDATDAVNALMDADTKHFNPQPRIKERPIRTPATPALRDKSLDSHPATWDRVLFQDKQITPTGDLFYVDRVTTPKRLAVYRPASLKDHPKTNPQEEPLKYHVFFHPTIFPNSFPGKYPDSTEYLSLMVRYLINGVVNPKDVDHPNPYNGHAMLYQHEAFDACKVIFIFPVGSANSQMGDITSQDGLLRLLQEVNYFIQRMDDVAWPLQPVGSVALSSFSAGIRNVRKVLTSTTNDLFEAVLLKEIYIFDGVLSPDPGGALYKSFIKALLNWWQEGDAERTIRLYTQTLSYFSDLLPHVQGGQETVGAANAREVDSDRATLIFVPANNFWQPISQKGGQFSEKNYNFWFVHQLIPSVFMTHALEHSAL